MEKRKKRSAFDKFSAFLFGMLKKSFIGKYFTSYDKANAKFQKITNTKNKRSHHKNRFVKILENNVFARIIPKAFHALLRIAVRNYAMIFFTMGLVILPQYFLNSAEQSVFGFVIPGSVERLIFSIALIVFSLPFLFYGKSLAYALLNNRLFSFVAFKLLGVDDENIKTMATKKRVSKTSIALILGALLGLSTYFINPFVAIIVLVSILFAYNVFRTPEIGVILIILTLPFVKAWVIKIAIVYVFFCYIIKVILRKRVFSFEYHDVFATLAIIAMVFCGIDYQNPRNSLPIIFSNMVIFMAYYLCSNLIRSRTWFRKCIFALTTSALITALVAIVQLVLGLLSGIDELSSALSAFTVYKASVPSVFASNDVFAQYLMIAIPFGLIHLISGKKTPKVGSFFITLTLLIALVISNSKYAFIGIACAVVLLLIIYNRNNIYLALALIASAIGLYFLVENVTVVQEFVDKIHLLDGFDINAKLLELKDGFRAIFSFPQILGTGAGSIANEYDSLLIQLVLEYGITTLIFLALFAVAFIRLVASHCQDAKKVSRKIESATGLCALVGLFITGIFKNVWQDEKIMLLSIAFVALSFAFIKREKISQTIMDEKSDLSRASIDIELEEEDLHEYSTVRKYVHAPKNMRELNKHKMINVIPDSTEIIRITKLDDVSDDEIIKKKKKKKKDFDEDDDDIGKTNY